MLYNNILNSNDRKNIKSEIMKILGGKILTRKNIDEYISTKLESMKGIMSKEEIDEILRNTGIIPYDLSRNTDIGYLKNLYFLLKHNIPLGQDFSIFSNENRITNRRYEVGLGRAYNILSNEKFNEVDGLRDILIYLNIEKGAKYHAEVFKFLQKDSYKQYFDTFKLKTGVGHSDFFTIINMISTSDSYIGRCMLLGQYLDKYNATFFSFSNTENIPYKSFRKSYKNHNNSTKTNKTQAFTYLFYQLYKDMTEKNLFKSSMAKFKNDTKTLTKTQLEQKIKNINTANQKGSKQLYYKQKITVLEDRIKYINKKINDIRKIKNKRQILRMKTNKIISPDVKNVVITMQKNLFNKQIKVLNKKVSANPRSFTRNKELRKYIKNQKPELEKQLKEQKNKNLPIIERKISQGNRKRAAAKARANAAKAKENAAKANANAAKANANAAKAKENTPKKKFQLTLNNNTKEWATMGEYSNEEYNNLKKREAALKNSKSPNSITNKLNLRNNNASLINESYKNRDKNVEK